MNYMKAIKRAKVEAKKSKVIAMRDIRKTLGKCIITESALLQSLEFDFVYLPVFN